MQITVSCLKIPPSAPYNFIPSSLCIFLREISISVVLAKILGIEYFQTDSRVIKGGGRKRIEK